MENKQQITPISHLSTSHVENWDFDRFKIKCTKCLSEDVIIFFREESGVMGPEYTSYMKWFNYNNGMIIKCNNCGQTMEIDLPDEV